MTKEIDPNVALVGQRVREARKAAGLTQGALAAALGETWRQTHIASIEGGRRPLTLAWLFRVAEVLGVEAWRLLAERPITKTRRARHIK